MTRKHEDKTHDGMSFSGRGGVFGGLTDLIEKLGELAETGKELSKTGQFSSHHEGKELKGVYGFNIRVGLGEEPSEVKVEPFGNIKRDEESGKTVVQEVREPLVDIFEEPGHTLVLAEMPGISFEHVKLDVRDDVLTISADGGDKKYLKEVLLPRAYAQEDVEFSCNNGIVEIKCSNK